MAAIFFEIQDDKPNHGQYHLPYHPNLLFIGRESWLVKLHDQLTGGGDVTVTQAVAGLGGVGKTQLALAYCYRHLQDYDLIQWLRADDTSILDSEFAEMGYRLGITRRSGHGQDSVRQQVLKWLHSSENRWLLVFDNADNIQPNELSLYLPQMGNGASLITTRNPNWGGLAQLMRLELFTENEAVDFLIGQRNENLGLSNETREAKKLAEILGYLPLALEHARAYVVETGCSLANYREYYVTEREELWQDLPAPEGYDQRTIITTWELAFEQVRATPGAAALLNLCCFLDPDEIPTCYLTFWRSSVMRPKTN